MDYKKAYKEALERARNIRFGNPNSATANVVCEEIFPEIKESEDEKIRKEVEEAAKDWYKENYEGENPQGKALMISAYIDGAIAWLEKQGNYNRLVEEIKERKELISKEKEKATSTNDKLSLGGRIAILEELLAFTKEKQDEQKPVDSYCKEHCKGFQETGKCFADGECKAKREAEQNLAWSEEDEKMMQCIHKYIKASASNFDYDNIQIWFRNLKKRIQLQQKQEWSEEDEYVLKDVITAIDIILTSAFQENNPNLYKSFEVAKHWLKSLKPQSHWKPTNEQMEAFGNAIEFLKDSDYSVHELIILFNDLQFMRV